MSLITPARGRPLPLAMCLLLPSTGPETWTSAVREAARILVPEWDNNRPESNALGTLSLLLWARTCDGQRTPDKVPLQELQDALNAPPLATGEPAIREEIWEALETAGFRPPAPLGDRHPVWEICSVLSDQYRVVAPDGPEPPGASPMRDVTPGLAERLARLPENGRRAGIPDIVPGTLHVDADTIILSSAHSLSPLRCNHETCPTRGGHLVVDGPAARFVCPDRHTSSYWRLSAAHARRALEQTGRAPWTQGRVQVKGPFYITVADRAEDARPTDNVFLNAR